MDGNGWENINRDEGCSSDEGNDEDGRRVALHSTLVQVGTVFTATVVR